MVVVVVVVVTTLYDDQVSNTNYIWKVCTYFVVDTDGAKTSIGRWLGLMLSASRKKPPLRRSCVKLPYGSKSGLACLRLIQSPIQMILLWHITVKSLELLGLLPYFSMFCVSQAMLPLSMWYL